MICGEIWEGRVCGFVPAPTTKGPNPMNVRRVRVIVKVIQNVARGMRTSAMC